MIGLPVKEEKENYQYKKFLLLAIFLYTRYYDPYTKKESDIINVIENN